MARILLSLCMPSVSLLRIPIFNHSKVYLMKNDFAKQYRPILEAASKEGESRGISVITPELFAFVIVSSKDGYAYRILSQLKVPVEKIAEEIEEYLAEPHSPGETASLFNYRLSVASVRFLKLASAEARKMGASVLGTEHLMLALLHDARAMDSELLKQIKEQYLNFDISIQGAPIPPMGMGLNPDDVKDNASAADDEEAEDSPSGSGFSSGKKSKNSKSDTPALDKFGYDMTKAAMEGRLDPVVGRENEIERLAQVLSRRKKNNPVLIGEPGVGKSAIVEGLALRIVQRKVSRVLFDKRVIGLDMTGMVAGTKYRGQFEERIKTVLDELSKNPDIILFIDEIHTIVGAGSTPGSMDAANILKPALARGEIQCIGATTLDEYRQNIEKDGALERRFQKVMVEPTSPEETLEILRNVKDKYEAHHNVRYTDEALQACVDLTERYVADRNFPDKALDALDEAGSRAHITNIVVPEEIESLELKVDQLTQDKLAAAREQDYERAAALRDQVESTRKELAAAKEKWEKSLDASPVEVDEDKVAEVVALMTGVPAQRVAQAEGARLIKMGESLKGAVIGQDEAIAKTVKAIQRNRIGLKDPGKPIGVFMFLGPTGVGKTHLAKKLAEYLFDSPKALIRMDMSEFMEKFTVSRLVGAPPGYVGYEEGGQLTEKVRRHPYSVVLLDEIEKAHPDVFNLLLQVMDEGHLTDSLGRKIDFKNTILVMTSNIGSRQLKEFGSGVGFNTETMSKSQAQGVIQKALSKAFSPEFLNRVDDIIMFDQLSKEAIFSIIDIELKDFFARVEKLGFTLRLSEQAKNFIAEKGYDKNYGARPLKRSIQKYLEDELAELMLTLNAEGALGGEIAVDYEEGAEKLSLKYTPLEEMTASSAEEPKSE